MIVVAEKFLSHVAVAANGAGLKRATLRTSSINCSDCTGKVESSLPPFLSALLEDWDRAVKFAIARDILNVHENLTHGYFWTVRNVIFLHCNTFSTIMLLVQVELLEHRLAGG